ncbi:MAG: hypothetical protein ACP5P4_12185 [Steroidobacteraceae bacterium]
MNHPPFAIKTNPVIQAKIEAVAKQQVRDTLQKAAEAERRPSFKAEREPNMMENVAKIEHEAMMIDREGVHDRAQRRSVAAGAELLRKAIGL